MPVSLVDNLSSRGKPGLMSSTNFSVANATIREHPVNDPLEGIRGVVLAHLGEGGIKAIGRIFRIMDTDGNKKLSPEELSRGFLDCGVELSPNDVSCVFAALDKDDDGNIDMSEFMALLKGRMPRCRLAIVEKAWNTLNRNSDDLVTVKHLLDRYQVMNHPEVVKGERTKDDIYMEFLSMFEGPMANENGMVSKDDIYMEFLSMFEGPMANENGMVSKD
eukprot:Tbor_TRINITY_DN5137_c0_g1::TRINITY_DN5137_c0_g1_i3::g.25577::m.25577